MNRQLKIQDHLFLAGAFFVMTLLFWSSTNSYKDQSLTSFLENVFSSRPFEEELSQISFVYAGEKISIQVLGYYHFIEFFVRKAAHFISFALLGTCWYLGLKKRIRHEWLLILIAFMLSVGYASFDELRQVFHPGRSGLMADVYLDSLGALTGILIPYGFDKLGK